MFVISRSSVFTITSMSCFSSLNSIFRRGAAFGATVLETMQFLLSMSSAFSVHPKTSTCREYEDEDEDENDSLELM